MLTHETFNVKVGGLSLSGLCVLYPIRQEFRNFVSLLTAVYIYVNRYRQHNGVPCHHNLAMD